MSERAWKAARYYVRVRRELALNTKGLFNRELWWGLLKGTATWLLSLAAYPVFYLTLLLIVVTLYPFWKLMERRFKKMTELEQKAMLERLNR